MANFEIFKVTKTYYGGWGTHDLDNGDTIEEVGDGTAHSIVNDKAYVRVSRGVGEPDKDGDFEEYEELGWAYASDCPCGVIE